MSPGEGKLVILATTAAGGQCEVRKLIELGGSNPPAGSLLECPFPTNRETRFLLDFPL
jgi:hypothetical protein